MVKNIKKFAEVLESQQVARLHAQDLACQCNIDSVKVTIKEGKKYTKVNVGNSGKYMIDKEGNIFGIKGYGVINKKHHYGTLDTIDKFTWGNYKARQL